MTRRTQDGFTLIELMIVVVVIGLLSAVAIPSYQGYVTRARMSETVAMVSPAQISLGEACLSGFLNGATNATLGMPAATQYASAKVISSITAVGNSASEATITVVLKKFGGVQAGQTLVYKGACSLSGMNWSVDASSTVPAAFFPKT